MGERVNPSAANPDYRHRLTCQVVGMHRSCRATTIKARNHQGSNKEAGYMTATRLL